MVAIEEDAVVDQRLSVGVESKLHAGNLVISFGLRDHHSDSKIWSHLITPAPYRTVEFEDCVGSILLNVT